MLENTGFDQWAGNYDRDIQANQDKGYPFAGYFQTLSLIQQKILKSDSGRCVLDIGIGTGLLTEILYQNGFEITGIDFSEGMLEQAREKMPAARLILVDVMDGLVEKIAGEQFDFILSSYTLHHFCDEEKIQLLTGLIGNLAHNGSILIGDIAFQNVEQREKVKRESAGWDEAEFYFSADEMLAALAEYPIHADFIQTSMCSGVLIMQKDR
ncbi:MAG: class I SAM-dependent methyltransferase [Anaerolineales bacterium]|nr:class I SAM-dependent methyltransferase [Anaerolineales bacterium]